MASPAGYIPQNKHGGSSIPTTAERQEQCDFRKDGNN